MKRGLEKFYELIESFEALPSIGRKSAVRLAYYIVYENSFAGLKLAHSIEEAVSKIKKCSLCKGLSEDEICEICLDENRDKQTLCIVQSAKDIFILEETKQFKGIYLVISELNEDSITHLIDLVKTNNIKSILFAITPSIANEAFILYIEDRLKDFEIEFNKIAHGIPTGISLENVDMLSLSKAIESKVKI